MHKPRPLEYCFVCDEPTGRAGQGDGSLYCECDKGPFCEECWNKHHSADTKVADLLKELELSLEWLDNLFKAHNSRTIVNSMPNNWGGRIGIRKAIGKAKKIDKD